MSSPRNAPCPCGSGKKYKRCCLRRDQEARLEEQGTRRSRARERDDDPFAGRRGRSIVPAVDADDWEDDPLWWDVFPYDPDEAPDPEAWLELDEDERMLAVRAAHRGELDELEPAGARMHVALHVTVENQVAEGDGLPVAAKIEELVADGLSRHDAVHAVASALSAVMWEASEGRLAGDADLNEGYFARLEELTAQSWLDEVGGKG